MSPRRPPCTTASTRTSPASGNHRAGPNRCFATLAGRPRRWWEVAEMSASLLAVIVDCHDPLRQAEFWSQALAYKVRQRNPGEFLVSDPAGAGAPLYFMKVPEPK